MLKDFDQSKEWQTIAKKSLQRISVLLRLRRDFVITKLVGKQEMNIHAALGRFRKI